MQDMDPENTSPNYGSKKKKFFFSRKLMNHGPVLIKLFSRSISKLDKPNWINLLEKPDLWRFSLFLPISNLILHTVLWIN